MTIATIIVYAVVIFSYFLLRGVTGEVSLLYPYAAVLATVVASLVLFYWLKERADYLDKVSEEVTRTRVEIDMYKKLVEAKTHTYHVIDSTKEIKILNSKGDVELKYSYRCENTSERDIEQVRIRVVHDGNIESLACQVNGVKVKPHVVSQTVTIDEKTGKEISALAHTLLFYIHPEKLVKPMEQFEYNYAYKGNRLYPKIEKEEHTSTSIQHPTSRLTTAIFAPEGYVFTPSSVRIEVLERDDSRHLKEEERVMSKCPPICTNGQKTIIWALSEPLLANTYKIYIAIEKMPAQ